MGVIKTVDVSGEQTLLFSFTRGEEKAFRHYYEMYYDALCLFGTRVTRDNEVAMDIAQNVFVSLCKKRATIESELHLKMFLYQAMRHRCLDYLRSRKMLEKYSDEYRKLESGEDYRNMVVEEEVFRLVMGEVHLLPEEQQKVILLHLEGKSNAEIAGLLYISVNTVKTHKARARQQLKVKLKDLFILTVLLNL